MKQIILPDTSLCAIVRDEKMNPAGGIKRFIDSHVPYVEQAVIADTGSVDGTREILEEMQAKYSNLKVVDFQFNGYADARNKSLKYVQTKRALILDADELLTHEQPQNDWEGIDLCIKQNPSEFYRFLFDEVYPRGANRGTLKGHTLRLFDVSIFENPFEGDLWESFKLSPGEMSIFIRGVSIKHFLPKIENLEIKDYNWYGESPDPSKEQIEHWQRIPPSVRDGFARWKEFNPLRDNYI
jgi:glycosyltransferase involved in cell wall biosynthesis